MGKIPADLSANGNDLMGKTGSWERWEWVVEACPRRREKGRGYWHRCRRRGSVWWWELVEVLFSLQLFFSIKWKAGSSAMSVMIEGAGQVPHLTSWWLGGKVAFILGPSMCAAQLFSLASDVFPGLYPSLSTATSISDFYLPEIV